MFVRKSALWAIYFNNCFLDKRDLEINIYWE